MSKEADMSKTRNYLIAGAALLALNGTAVAEPRPDGPTRNIVIVHGAFVDGSGRRAVHDILEKDGYRVSIVQEPLTGLADDVAATKRVLDLQDGPTVLVGHSYGGSVVTIAGADPKVTRLVYVAALQPDVGESAPLAGLRGVALFRETRTTAHWRVASETKSRLERT
jgi:pimeloyl-ACP methyl ester carboxylesterase